jgi:hypothetical protein
MYALAEYEISRQHREEIRHEVAANRLGRKLRANRKGRARMVRDLSRYAGLLARRLRSTQRRGQRIKQMP